MSGFGKGKRMKAGIPKEIQDCEIGLQANQGPDSGKNDGKDLPVETNQQLGEQPTRWRDAELQVLTWGPCLDTCRP